ncbi:HAMP domain-containing sensor histidine kinase [Paracidovorax citrulli]|uniref:histidine kinase n=2 Tax=Paracidovorax citrulli TaxID=80869 RepID=A1TSY5_PARC0|nr:HAMP domain-containing sensor histidine kinase [Paracidovorax citrulli]ABM34073.1 histidine kinase [Paracidovorax citrulli AAC00-1]ATG93590.1 sensor histidine kinase [Paracidovorax citrulli]PVY63511.1 histidine kinase [Paracidovorax citrulli]QCX09509.1 Bacteriophytochrome [Paracidovorax citrulli]REG67522.1 histidine kinase [Paracidovorax citrulli]
MRLAAFLESTRERILEEAVAYARTIPALRKTDDKALRDHLPQILEAISADLRTPQTRAQSIQKSHGNAPPGSTQSSAQTHGLMRAQSGIDIEQLVAEFRALRSSILRLWSEAHSAGPDTIHDITRFNEAIDQAVAESVQFYAQERERWREIFLGVLGHDLRGPLNAVALMVELMAKQGIAPVQQTAMLERGVHRMTTLLDSLLEYSRSNLGVGMVLHLAPTDLAAACSEEVQLQRLAHPGARIEFSAQGPTEGTYDASRVREALGNLVSNAVKHGDAGGSITVRVKGTAHGVAISVENAGELAPESIDDLFEPLRRGLHGPGTDRTHLGLGLFIARQIARAHHGDATGHCENHQVRFTLELPKG